MDVTTHIHMHAGGVPFFSLYTLPPISRYPLHFPAQEDRELPGPPDTPFFSLPNVLITSREAFATLGTPTPIRLPVTSSEKTMISLRMPRCAGDRAKHKHTAEILRGIDSVRLVLVAVRWVAPQVPV